MSTTKTKKKQKETTAKTQRLTDRQQRFIMEYLIDFNAAAAAVRAGYSKHSARHVASEILTYPHIQEKIKEAQETLSEKLQITQEWVLERYKLIEAADPNELVEHRRFACRYCYGKDFNYQWRTKVEYEQAKQEAILKEAPTPTDKGGYGYTTKKDPNPDCPMCDGDGLNKVFFHDTRKLSRGAMALFAGVKKDKHGIDIRLHDKVTALNQIARHLGFFEKDHKVEVSGKLDTTVALDALSKITEENIQKSKELQSRVNNRFKKDKE